MKDVDDTVWIGLEYFCEEGDEFWNMSDEDATKFAIHELTRMGVIAGPDDVLDSHRERVKKAYPAYFDTYDQMPELVEYLDSFGNLYCVGRNGQHRYNNMNAFDGHVDGGGGQHSHPQDLEEQRVVGEHRQVVSRIQVMVP